MFDDLFSNPAMIAASCGFIGALVGWAAAALMQPRAPSQDELEDLTWLRTALNDTDTRCEALQRKILALETELQERRAQTLAPFSLRTPTQPPAAPSEQLQN